MQVFCLCISFCFSFVVRDVVIVGGPNPNVQLNTTQPADTGSAAQMEATIGESANPFMFVMCCVLGI